MRPRFGAFVASVALAGWFAAGPAPRARAAEAPQEPPAPQNAAPAPALGDEARLLNLQSFDWIWTTIRDRHWDPTLGGLDWDAVRDELRPRVEAAATMGEARGAMEDMIGRLRQSHFAIFPVDVYEEIATPGGDSKAKKTAGGDGSPGFDVRVEDGAALVSSVDEGSPADDAGVRPGWVVAAVDAEDVPVRLARVAEQFAGQTLCDLMLARSLSALLSGPIGESVAVTFLDGADNPVECDLPLAGPRGRKFQFGYLPPVHVWIETGRVPAPGAPGAPAGNGVGRIAFNAFLDPAVLMPLFDDAMRSFQDADGVIVDLRGNPGGIGAMAMGMAGWFLSEEDRYLGTMKTRDLSLKFIVNPRFPTFAGPLAVLVDGLSASTSEIFANGLRDLGRARIFGSRTAGAALPSVIEPLPNGDGFQYAVADYVSAGGRVLEGTGVTPDGEARLDRDTLLAGHDAALETALDWIEQTRRRSLSKTPDPIGM